MTIKEVYLVDTCAISYGKITLENILKDQNKEFLITPGIMHELNTYVNKDQFKQYKQLEQQAQNEKLSDEEIIFEELYGKTVRNEYKKIASLVEQGKNIVLKFNLNNKKTKDKTRTLRRTLNHLIDSDKGIFYDSKINIEEKEEKEQISFIFAKEENDISQKLEYRIKNASDFSEPFSSTQDKRHDLQISSNEINAYDIFKHYKNNDSGIIPAKTENIFNILHQITSKSLVYEAAKSMRNNPARKGETIYLKKFKTTEQMLLNGSTYLLDEKLSQMFNDEGKKKILYNKIKKDLKLYLKNNAIHGFNQYEIKASKSVVDANLLSTQKYIQNEYKRKVSTVTCDHDIETMGIAYNLFNGYKSTSPNFLEIVYLLPDKNFKERVDEITEKKRA